MNEIKEFYDLDVWKTGHKLVIDVYQVTKTFPREEIYGLVSQIRRAASSITANIAEGFSRYHYRDKIKFYYNARGSVSEVQNFLLIAFDLDYIDRETHQLLFAKANDVSKMINGVVRSIEKQIKDQ